MRECRNSRQVRERASKAATGYGAGYRIAGRRASQNTVIEPRRRSRTRPTSHVFYARHRRFMMRTCQPHRRAFRSLATTTSQAVGDGLRRPDVHAALCALAGAVSVHFPALGKPARSGACAPGGDGRQHRTWVLGCWQRRRRGAGAGIASHDNGFEDGRIQRAVSFGVLLIVIAVRTGACRAMSPVVIHSGGTPAGFVSYTAGRPRLFVVFSAPQGRFALSLGEDLVAMGGTRVASQRSIA